MGKAENKLGADDTWATSHELLDGIAGLGEIGLDPCSHPRSVVRSREAVLLPSWKYARDAVGQFEVPMRELHFEEVPRPVNAGSTILGDGLAEKWDGRGLVYWNPPYSELGLWLLKGATEGDTSLGLVPIRSGNKEWWPANTADVRCDLPRQTFLGAAVHAPFHLCLLWWGDPWLGMDVLGKLGHATPHARHTMRRMIPFVLDGEHDVRRGGHLQPRFRLAP